MRSGPRGRVADHNPDELPSPSRLCSRGGTETSLGWEVCMRRAWNFMTVGALIGAACFDPTAGSQSGTLTLGGTSADQLALSVQPQNAVARQIITPAVQVTALDPLGNTDVSFTGAVTMSLGTNPGGGFLGGTLTVGAVNGVASFGDLTVSSGERATRWSPLPRRPGPRARRATPSTSRAPEARSPAGPQADAGYGSFQATSNSPLQRWQRMLAG